MSAVLFEPAVGSDFSPISPEASRSGGVQVLTAARRIVLAGAKGGQGSTTVAAAMAVFAFTVMDAGRIEQLPGPEERTITVAVVRGPCYLALRPLVGAGGPQPDGIVLVREPGRSLTATDVEDVTGVPVFATVDVSPIVARTIDAGLLVVRLDHLDEPARTSDGCQ